MDTNAERDSLSSEDAARVVAGALSERYYGEARVPDATLSAALVAATASEEALSAAVADATAQLGEANDALARACDETFQKLPRYIELLRRIGSNLAVLGGNARRLKELAAQVANECQVPLPPLGAKAPGAAVTAATTK
jgi:hypothetical protein